MQKTQARNLLLLAASATLFLFSLSLVPAVEFYCRYRRPALILLAIQIVLLAMRAKTTAPGDSKAVAIAAWIFTSLGIVMNALVFFVSRGRC